MAEKTPHSGSTQPKAEKYLQLPGENLSWSTQLPGENLLRSTEPIPKSLPSADAALALCVDVFRYMESRQPEFLQDGRRDQLLAAVSVGRDRAFGSVSSPDYVPACLPVCLSVCLSACLYACVTASNISLRMRVCVAVCGRARDTDAVVPIRNQPVGTHEYHCAPSTVVCVAPSQSFEEENHGIEIPRGLTPPQREGVVTCIQHISLPEARASGGDADANNVTTATSRML